MDFFFKNSNLLSYTIMSQIFINHSLLIGKGSNGHLKKSLLCKYMKCFTRYLSVNSSAYRSDNSGIKQIVKDSSVLKEPSEDVRELLENSASFQDQQPQTEEQVWSTAPYPNGAVPRSQASYALRPHIDPKETSIILFPGQGTQYVGMGKNLLKVPIVQELFDKANTILGYDLLNLCLNGPKGKLDQTKYCQAAIFVCSIAAVEVLKDETPGAIENCIATAGFSVGELTALVFAGVLSFERALRLVKVRGEAMDLASQITPGGMMTVLNAPDSKLNEACKNAKEWALKMGVESPECVVANYLFPECKVIAGHNEALEYIEKNMKHYNLRRIKRLPVSGAFHTRLMKPALEPFCNALSKVELNEPMIAVHSNVEGKMYRNSNHIRRLLPEQIVRPVKWEQTMHILFERPEGLNFPSTYECGPGNSLRTILKMVNGKATDTFKNVAA